MGGGDGWVGACKSRAGIAGEIRTRTSVVKAKLAFPDILKWAYGKSRWIRCAMLFLVGGFVYSQLSLTDGFESALRL